MLEFPKGNVSLATQGIEGSNLKFLATAVAQRHWIRKGIRAQEAGNLDDEFYMFWDALQTELLRRTMEKADLGSSSWNAYHRLLESAWKEEYGVRDKGEKGMVVNIVRPARDDTSGDESS